MANTFERFNRFRKAAALMTGLAAAAGPREAFAADPAPAEPTEQTVDHSKDIYHDYEETELRIYGMHTEKPAAPSGAKWDFHNPVNGEKEGYWHLVYMPDGPYRDFTTTPDHRIYGMHTQKPPTPPGLRWDFHNPVNGEKEGYWHLVPTDK